MAPKVPRGEPNEERHPAASEALHGRPAARPVERPLDLRLAVSRVPRGERGRPHKVCAAANESSPRPAGTCRVSRVPRWPSSEAWLAASHTRRRWPRQGSTGWPAVKFPAGNAWRPDRQLPEARVQTESILPEQFLTRAARLLPMRRTIYTPPAACSAQPSPQS